MPRRKTSTSYGEKHGNTPKGDDSTRPGPGRYPKSLVLHLKSIRRDAQAQLALLNAARDPDSKGFAVAWRVLGEYDDEKPAERKQIDAKVQVSVKIEREGRRRTAG